MYYSIMFIASQTNNLILTIKRRSGETETERSVNSHIFVDHTLSYIVIHIYNFLGVVLKPEIYIHK